MNPKVVHIIGGGLYGGLTAYMFAKYKPEYKVRLIESSNHLLSAFDSITLGDYKLNNGFHGIELPRSIELYNFFNDVLGVSFYKSFNNRGLSIQGEIISFLSKKEEWPFEFQKFIIANSNDVILKDYDISSIVSQEFESLVRFVSKRYTENFEDVKGLFIPWFLPADLNFKSNDEGDVFRNNVRSGIIDSFYGFPETELFEDVQNNFLKTLTAMNVDVIFNEKLTFDFDKIIYENENLKNDLPEKVFFCASPAIIIKDLHKELMVDLLRNKRYLFNVLFNIKSDDFQLNTILSEIIALDRIVPQIGRISFPKIANSPKNTFVQVELFIGSETIDEHFKSFLTENMKRILKLSQDDQLQLIDIKCTRSIFFPTAEQRNHAFEKMNETLATYKTKLHVRNNFGPINMAKTWLYAKENINL
jgi:hypothetical protein